MIVYVLLEFQCIASLLFHLLKHGVCYTRLTYSFRTFGSSPSIWIMCEAKLFYFGQQLGLEINIDLKKQSFNFQVKIRNNKRIQNMYT